MSLQLCFSLKWAIPALLALMLTLVEGKCWSFLEPSSTPQRPLKQIAEPLVHTLEILPRPPSSQQRLYLPISPVSISPGSPILRHSDSFRLTLSAFDQPFHLHLHPNPHLLHSSARINYYKNGPNGQATLDYSKPLLQDSVKAYWGDVIHPDITLDRMREDTVGGLLKSDNKPLGWARIIVHHQGDVGAGVPPVFEGAFSVNGDIHHVMTKESYMRAKHILDPRPSKPVDDTSPLVIFRESDIMSHHEASGLFSYMLENIPIPDPDTSTCSHDHLPWNTDFLLNPTLKRPTQPNWYEKYGFYTPTFDDNSSIWNKRDDVAGGTGSSNFQGTIGQSAGCPIEEKIVYMGVAADCVYVQQKGSQQNATTSILNDWNMASALYKTTFNISLGILEVDMHDPTCPSPPDTTRPWNVDCNSNVTLNDRLSLFSKWRGDKGEDGTGLWHLMSGCPTGTEVGVAWLGTLCQTTATGTPGNFVSGVAVTTSTMAEWQVVSHEIGHNFGAICTSGCNSTSPCCPLTTNQCDSNGQFIMSPTASQAEAHFSACTLGNICSLMQSTTNMTCIQPPDLQKQTFALQMCGNGIVEIGEDCDPGPDTNSTCCDSATCKFTAGSVCDVASSPCCTPQCQFAPSTQVCRPAQDPQCDIAESCNGTSAACPWDKTQPNGQSCGSNGLACASGKCTSPSQQCQTIGMAMGLTTACPSKGDTSCQVSCVDPQNDSQCVVLQAQLIDGSPCGYAGKCMTGNCQPGSLLDTAEAWYVQNLQISVPVSVVVGIVLLFILYGLYRCARRCCCGSRRAKSVEPGLNAVQAQRLASWAGPPVPGSGPEPGVWVPPLGGSVRSQSRYGARSSDIPSVLQAGSKQVILPTCAVRSSQRAAPSVAANARAGYGAQDRRGTPDGSQSNWVDPAAWNGRPS
ncbi:hypothetical protein K439DRAFT_1655063 [Ramaria rubella]|nr:hypothetical protein K439DRAFT_1655063 [Ramaria rubella]